MLVQYEATTHKSTPSVLVGEASSSKAKSKRVGYWKRKKGKGKAIATTASALSAPTSPMGLGKVKGKVGGSQQSKANDVCNHCKEREIGRGSAHDSSPTKMLERSRKLSKDEMILKLGDGKAVDAEVVGSLDLAISDHKVLANGLLNLIHTDVSGSLNTPAGGEFSYFITFTDDHSWYGYVYLMRYKSEAFGWFKEYRLEVDNQTGRKIKALRSDRGGEYLSGELIDYLKENGILSQWTPPEMPQLNGVAERRNRTLFDMGHTLETAAKLHNIAPSKTLPHMPYEIWHGKPVSYKYLRVWIMRYGMANPSRLCPLETVGYYFYDPSKQKVFLSRNVVFLEKGFPADSRRDEVLLEETSETPQQNKVTSFEPIVPTNGAPALRRSIRESRPPNRYGFLGLTSQLDNDLRTYGEAMLDIDSEKWLEAMKSKMDSIDSNQIWTLVDPPNGVKPLGCKWVYKCKLEAWGKVTALKARLVAKAYIH
ncbi:UNVERIFIED_CONTAM: Retrovirus-related Pol polyprotein from transposon TNT 1-94 [Sesamum indicum]